MTRAQIEAIVRQERRKRWAKAKREGREYGPKAPEYVQALDRQTDEARRRELRRKG